MVQRTVLEVPRVLIAIQSDLSIADANGHKAMAIKFIVCPFTITCGVDAAGRVRLR